LAIYDVVIITYLIILFFNFKDNLDCVNTSELQRAT
jgi:hypothetical protein